MEWVVNPTFWQFYPQARDLISIEYEDVCPRVVMDRNWTLALTSFRTLDLQPIVNHYTTHTIVANTSWMNMEL